MNNYEFTLTVEPTDKYEKTKQDFLKAMAAVQELTPREKERLVIEVIGTTDMVSIYDYLRKYFG